MMTRDQRRQLPKARWFRLSWSWRWFYFTRFRCANFMRWQIGWLTVEHRMPYIEHVARQNYPEIFAEPAIGGPNSRGPLGID